MADQTLTLTIDGRAHCCSGIENLARQHPDGWHSALVDAAYTLTCSYPGGDSYPEHMLRRHAEAIVKVIKPNAVVTWEGGHAGERE